VGHGLAFGDVGPRLDRMRAAVIGGIEGRYSISDRQQSSCSHPEVLRRHPAFANLVDDEGLYLTLSQLATQVPCSVAALGSF